VLNVLWKALRTRTGIGDGVKCN